MAAQWWHTKASSICAVTVNHEKQNVLPRKKIIFSTNLMSKSKYLANEMSKRFSFCKCQQEDACKVKMSCKDDHQTSFEIGSLTQVHLIVLLINCLAKQT